MSVYNLLTSFLLVLVVSHLHVRGDYTLRVLVSGYSNPGSTCYQCTSGGVQGCCDDFDLTICASGGRECDELFYYCLMPLGSSPPTETVVAADNFITRAGELGCLPQSAQWSLLNNNAATINFMSATVLGLPNPLVFEVTAPRWQGITLYVDVIDEDSITSRDLIDIFVVDLIPDELVAGAAMTETQSFQGRFGIATIELSFQLECLTGFFGGECLDSTLICDSTLCSNDGICEPDVISAGGFTCTCVGDFTGQTCDVVIDDCLSVNCNNGSCVDGVQSFTCECEVGYTGEFCEQVVGGDVTTPTDTTEGTTADNSNTVLAPVVGGVVGGFAFVLLLVITLTVVLTLLRTKWRTQKKTQEVPEKTEAVTISSIPLEDNVAYSTISMEANDAYATTSSAPLEVNEVTSPEDAEYTYIL